MSTQTTAARRALLDPATEAGAIPEPVNSQPTTQPHGPETDTPELVRTSPGIAKALIMPFLFALMLPLVMIGIMHSPTPRHMDLAVIGTSAQATQAATQLSAAGGTSIDVQQLATDAQAQDKIRHRDIRAAWNPATSAVYVASAGGTQASTTATRIFTQASAGHPVNVHDIAAPTTNDPLGNSAVYLGLGAMVGGVFAGLVTAILGNALGDPLQALVLAASSAVIAGIEVLYGWSIFHLYPGHAWKPWMILLVLGFSTATITWGGAKLFGLYQIALSTVLLTFMGIASSGVSIPLDMAPRIYYWAHQILPTPRGISALKTHVYFPHASITWDIITMLVWAAAGLATGFLVKNLSTNRAATVAHLAGLE